MILKENKETKTDLWSCSIHPSVGNMLVDQLSNELYNKLLYESFANFFAEKGFSLLETYYRKRASEEELHYQWIKHFLSENDYSYSHPGVDDVEETPKNLIDPFRMTLEAEVETTEQINAILDKAEEVKDRVTQQWLLSDSEASGCLIKEQAEEMNISRAILTIAENEENNWFNKEQAIFRTYTNSYGGNTL